MIYAIALLFALYIIIVMWDRPKYEDKAHAGQVRGLEPDDIQHKIRFGFIQPITDCVISDTSKWDAAIDYLKMMFAGIHGTILKAGQGTVADSWFLINWKLARVFGIKRGSYWFYDSRVDPKIQAAKWWSLLKDDIGELPHFVDYEENYGGAFGGVDNLRIFMFEFLRLSQLPDYMFGVYTGYFYWKEHGENDNFFRRFWLWLAWYGTPESVLCPLPWTMNEFLMWQFTSTAPGGVYGVSAEELDLSYFLKGRAEYQRMFGELVIPDEEGTDMLYRLTVLTAYLNGRDAPNGNINFPAGATLTTGFRVGDTLTADLEQNHWYRITGCIRAGKAVMLPSTVWAFAGDAFGYMRLDTTTDPPVVNPTATVEFTDSAGKVFTGTVELKPK